MRSSGAIIGALAISQAVDLPALSPDGIVITLDEMVLIVVLAVFLLGAHNSVRFKPALVMLAVLELAAQMTPEFSISLTTFALLGRSLVVLVSFTVLATLYQNDPAATLQTFGRTWNLASRLTAGIVVLQATAILPSVAYIGSQFVEKSRPTGLQGDPNFAALALSLSLLFAVAQNRRQTHIARLFIGTEVVAIFLTSSRMGLLLVVAVGLWWMHRSKRTTLEVWAAAVGSLVLLSVSMLALGVDARETGSLGRFDELHRTYDAMRSGEIVDGAGHRKDSGTERIVLAYGAATAWLDNPVWGVGIDQLQPAIAERTGVRKASHNSTLR